MPSTPSDRQQKSAVVLSFLILLAFAVGLGWLAVTGVQSGETQALLKRPSLRRPILREKEPAFFWTCVGIYGVGSLGSAGLAIVLVRASRSPSSSHESMR